MADHFEQLSKQGFGFAIFPEVRIFDQPGGKSIQHLIFGDYISPPRKSSGFGNKKWTESLLQDFKETKWINVRSRQEDGWIKLDDIQTQRTLEINFVDIGQGDGCHLVTPDDEHFIIDAGEGDNMFRFLRWRFNLNSKGGNLPKFSAIISHPDEDHWKGFQWLLSNPPENMAREIIFDTLYHNGILQRSGSRIGKIIKVENEKYLSEIISDKKTLQNILQLDGKKSDLENFFIKTLQNFPELKIQTLHKEPGVENILYRDDKMSMEVLAPIPDMIGDQLMLKWFDSSSSSIGKTKNGHSIVLVARIGKMRILLGGDLNSRSADHVMEKLTGRDLRKLRIDLENASEDEKIMKQEEMNTLISECRIHLEAEVTKSCHHGSHDITNEFLRAVNPIATIISSGDEESFCHPRPETLGAIGKFGRGDRPLIFSTELARSSPEFFEVITKKYKTDSFKQRIVSTYGMITLRTDGERTVICQKLEKNRSTFGLITKWHVDKIIWNDERGEFISKN